MEKLLTNSPKRQTPQSLSSIPKFQQIEIKGHTILRLAVGDIVDHKHSAVSRNLNIELSSQRRHCVV